jgi:hypothetical protein
LNWVELIDLQACAGPIGERIEESKILFFCGSSIFTMLGKPTFSGGNDMNIYSNVINIFIEKEHQNRDPTHTVLWGFLSVSSCPHGQAESEDLVCY